MSDLKNITFSLLLLNFSWSISFFLLWNCNISPKKFIFIYSIYKRLSLNTTVLIAWECNATSDLQHLTQNKTHPSQTSTLN